MYRMQVYSGQDFPITEYRALAERLYGNVQPHLEDSKYLTGVVQVLDDNQTLGLVSVYHNPLFPDTGFIGQFESVEDKNVMSKLLGEAETLVRRSNRSRIVGPMNGSTWYPYRFRLSAGHPFFSEFIHKDYYLGAWLEYGFDYNDMYLSNHAVIDEDFNIPHTEGFYIKRNLSKRAFSLEKNDLERIYGLCNAYFVNNPWYSPIGLGEFITLYTNVIPKLDVDLIDLVFDERELVALFFALPDYYNKNRVVIKTIVRNPSRKYCGLGRILTYDFYKKALRMGYKEMIHAYIHANNPSLNVSRRFKGEVFRRYALLSKTL